MKSFAGFLLLALVAVAPNVSAVPLTFKRRAIDPTLVPEFGLRSGLNPTGTGDCDGITNAAGNVVQIPCFCPPDRNEFITALERNVAAGRVTTNPSVLVSFPEGQTKDAKLARMQTALVTLQNMRGAGVGCPAASTTFLAQQKAIVDGTDEAPAQSPSTPNQPAQQQPAPQTPAPAGVEPALVPDFGVTAGRNPTGTGDCDGITNAAGQVVKIPCFCPPNRDDFIASLSANVAAGRVVNNTGIAVSFPRDSSKASKLARMQAALVTLQNLRGPGVGCPAASTTFLAQQKAIQDGTDQDASAPPKQSEPSNPLPSTGAKIDPALVPELGHRAGLNPTGTGDCDGVANGAGVIVKIPCACPPDRDSFITALSANVAARHAVNNTEVTFSFPEGDSNEAKAARIRASLVTLQNMRGPGVGCPAASTTLLAQLRAVE